MQHERLIAHFTDMFQAIGAVQGYTADMTVDEFFSNTVVFDAVVRQLTVLGEAANRVPDDVQKQMPELPWIEMRGLRNFVVHQYDEINKQTIWDTATLDLPPVQRHLQRILGAEPPVEP